MKERGDMVEAIIVAIISLVGTLAGSYFSQRKTTVLIAYRIEELEKKVHAHNNLIDRTYKLEQEQRLQEEKIIVANHRIADLEKER